MTKAHSIKGAALLLFAALAAAGTVAAYLVANAKADGRTLDATFCTGGHGLCIQVASDQGTATGVMGDDSQSVLALRPGVYWLTVTDTSSGHNFALRSCPGAAVLCDQNSGGDVQPLTPVNNGTPVNGVTPVITDTVKVKLSHGTYRLFCQVGTHEIMGMHVDFLVGGVGQVGSGVGSPS